MAWTLSPESWTLKGFAFLPPRTQRYYHKGLDVFLKPITIVVAVVNPSPWSPWFQFNMFDPITFYTTTYTTVGFTEDTKVIVESWMLNASMVEGFFCLETTKSQKGNKRTDFKNVEKWIIEFPSLSRKLSGWGMDRPACSASRRIRRRQGWGDEAGAPDSPKGRYLRLAGITQMSVILCREASFTFCPCSSAVLQKLQINHGLEIESS